METSAEDPDDVYTCGVCYAKINISDLTNHVFLHDDYSAFSYDETTKIIEPITEAVKNNIVNVEVADSGDVHSQAYNLATTASALVDLGTGPDQQGAADQQIGSDQVAIMYDHQTQQDDNTVVTLADEKSVPLSVFPNMSQIPVSLTNFNVQIGGASISSSVVQEPDISERTSLVGLQLNPSDDSKVQYITIQKPDSNPQPAVSKESIAQSNLSAYLKATVPTVSKLSTLNEIFVWNRGRNLKSGETVTNVQAPIIENGVSRLAECAVVFLRHVPLDRNSNKRFGEAETSCEEVPNVDGLDEMAIEMVLDSRRHMMKKKHGKPGRQMEVYKYKETGMSDTIAKELRKSMLKDSPAVAKYLQSMNIPNDDLQELESYASQQQQHAQSGDRLVHGTSSQGSQTSDIPSDNAIQTQSMMVMTSNGQVYTTLEPVGNKQTVHTDTSNFDAVNALVEAAVQMENDDNTKGHVTMDTEPIENNDYIIVEPHNDDTEVITEDGNEKIAMRSDEIAEMDTETADVEGESEVRPAGNIEENVGDQIVGTITTDIESISDDIDLAKLDGTSVASKDPSIKQEIIETPVRKSSRLQIKKEVKGSQSPKTKVVKIRIKQKSGTSPNISNIDVDTLGKKYGYFCSICNIKLPPETVLKEHLESHRTTKKVAVEKKTEQSNKVLLYYCSLCNKMFPSEEELKIHCQQHKAYHDFDAEAEEDEVECTAVRQDDFEADRYWEEGEYENPSGTVVTVKRLKTRAAVKKVEHSLVCNICDKEFYNRSTLYAHKKTHGRVEDNDFSKCPKGCGQKFKSEIEVDLHGPFCVKNIEGPRERVCSEDEDEGLRCPFCRKDFETKAKKKFHSLVCQSRPEEECPICNFKCRGQLAMSKHQVKTHGIKPYKCNICDREFKLKGSLRDHIKSSHTDAKHTCEHCGKKFVKLNVYKRHLFVIHGGFRYPCNYCHKKFKDKRCWRIHENSHKGMYEYSCVQCRMSFSKAPDYKIHMIEVHNIEGTEALELNKEAKKIRQKLCKVACSYCKEKFPLEGAFLHHLQKVHNLNQTEAFEEFNKVCPNAQFDVLETE
ncbi:zinc finger and BTB domain-containing protein 11-like [Mya arenaria]|uniref:zinc finger and BTB domain-containing protein 11-like n=1 Tax=Mya arenaria TaxID=6604 RepID=UPI0022E1B360|nr:zinc finger and BTB domain-containing protein 11-like [Mya arenaria]XP_052804509.1 zinc finger and BTB domain-containing protein 11-like [Mya arenaria]XP_052804510.1 zinc finger and BTB domain-containing protein 11-like [Mya arenaria]